jgi:hypothetical protein
MILPVFFLGDELEGRFVIRPIPPLRPQRADVDLIRSQTVVLKDAASYSIRLVAG